MVGSDSVIHEVKIRVDNMDNVHNIVEISRVYDIEVEQHHWEMGQVFALPQFGIILPKLSLLLLSSCKIETQINNITEYICLLCFSHVFKSFYNSSRYLSQKLRWNEKEIHTLCSCKTCLMAARLAWLPGPLLLDAASDMADITAALKPTNNTQTVITKLFIKWVLNLDYPLWSIGNVTRAQSYRRLIKTRFWLISTATMYIRDRGLQTCDKTGTIFGVLMAHFIW